METDTAVIVFVHEETETEFRWHGGAYIDVGYSQSQGRETGDPFEAFDVINVWDDEHDVSTFEVAVDPSTPVMERTETARPFRAILEMFEARCREYMDEGQPENEATAE